ncbi:MAG: hypothetical protein ACYDER_20370 [Ktedonobacteraceae bacterium]
MKSFDWIQYLFSPIPDEESECGVISGGVSGKIEDNLLEIFFTDDSLENI